MLMLIPLPWLRFGLEKEAGYPDVSPLHLGMLIAMSHGEGWVANISTNRLLTIDLCECTHAGIVPGGH